MGGTRARVTGVGVVLAAGALVVGSVLPGSVSGQSVLDRTANLSGPWVSEAGIAHFHVGHRFWVTDPPTRKVVNTPTILAAAGLGGGFLVGGNYGSNSSLVPGTVNEWEAFVRWRALSQVGDGIGAGVVDMALSAGWNAAAESVDGEFSLARAVGPADPSLLSFRVLGSVRAFSRFAAAESDVALGGGAIWRPHRNVAVAGDLVTLTSADTTAAWGVALQLRIPTTPHTVSLHATNAASTTLQTSSFGGGRVLYGFEFTVPLTLSRYFGGGRSSMPAPSMAAAPSDTAVVSMDNRLRFVPDTIRIRAGQAVRWENPTPLVHTVTADPELAAVDESVRLPADAEPFDSGDIVPDGAYVRVFTVPGTYKYFCIPHERAGMVGWVVVEQQ